MDKMVPIELPPDLAGKLQEAADRLEISPDELLDRLLTLAMTEDDPEISGLIADAQAEVSRRGISMDQYIAEAEGAQHMTDLIIRLLKAK